MAIDLTNKSGLTGDINTIYSTPTFDSSILKTPTKSNVMSGYTLPSQTSTANTGLNVNNSPLTVSKPVSVISANSGATQQVESAKNVINEANQRTQQKSQNLYDPITGFVTSYGISQGATPVLQNDPNNKNITTTTTPTPAVTKTAEQVQLDEIQHPGQEEQYNIATGQKEWVTPGTTGYTKTNPNVAAQGYVDQADPGTGITIRKLSDGSFVRWNTLTNTYAGGASEGEYNQAKDVQTAQKRKNDVLNGIYSAEQQTQLDSIMNQYQSLIDKQRDINANTEGATTIAMNRYGLGDQLVGSGIITKTVNNGLQEIQNIQSQRDAAISKMKQSFLNDDMNLLKQAYEQYTQSEKEIQDKLDTIQKNLAETQKKQQEVETDNAIADFYDSGITEPTDIIRSMAKNGYTVTTEQVGKTLDVINKSVEDRTKKLEDVLNFAQSSGDIKTAEALLNLDVKSPTFNEDLAKLQGSVKVKATQEEKDAYTVSATYNTLRNIAGTDNYVDPYEYIRLRAESTMSPSEFDARFGNFVNPQSNNLVGFKTDETKLYNSTNIPSSVRAEIVDDLKNVKNIKLNDLYSAYPEVDTKYLTDLYESNQ